MRISSSASITQLKRARQILESLADETRLRIINLLAAQTLNVTNLCHILEKNQPIVSKHLARLRHLGLVSDRREGMNVYYNLTMSRRDPVQASLIDMVTKKFQYMVILKNDLKEIKKNRIR